MVLSALIGYLLGSFPTAQIVARRGGVDPLRQGDGNPGWWNMRALVGERRAGLVLLGDVLKGALAALIVSIIWRGGDWWWFPYVGVLFAMIGHAFPVFARFKGGRSVLTWAGGMLIISPVPALIVIAAGLFVAFVVKHRIWGARLATFAFPVAQAFFEPRAHVAATGVLMAFIGLRFLFARPAGSGAPARTAPAE